MPFVHNGSLTFPVLKQVNLDTGRVYLGESPDEIYPSITRVLGKKEKPQLEAWKVRVGAEEAALVSARASNRGGGLHKASECFLSNQDMPTIWPHVAELWQHLRPWLEAHITTVYDQEQDLCSRALGVAGRTDLIADVDGKFSVVDFKQSDKPKKPEWVEDYYLQGTFYAVAIYEHTGRLPKQVVIPVTSPECLQIFTVNPNRYFAELRSRITDFYESYDRAVDIQKAS